MNTWSLFGSVDLDTSGFEKGLDRATSEARRAYGELQKDADVASTSFRTKLTAVGQDLATLGTTLSNSFAVPMTEVIQGLIKGARGLGDYASSLKNMSAQTGLSTDTLQEFNRVALEAGVSNRALSDAAFSLTRMLRTSTPEAAAFATAVEKLGIETRDAYDEVREMDDLLPEIVEALGDMANVTERNTLATQIFQRHSRDFIPIIALGGDKIRELSQAARDMGAVFSGEALDAANRFRIEHTLLQNSVKYLSTGLLLDLMPALTQLVITFREDVVPGARAVIRVIRDAVEWFSNLGQTSRRVLTALGTLLTVGGPLLMGLSAFVTRMLQLRLALSALRLMMLPFLGPVGILVTLATLIGSVAFAMAGTTDAVAKARDEIEETREKLEGSTSSWSALERSVLSAADMLRGEARAAFIEHASEAITTAETIEDAAADIAEAWENAAYDTELAVAVYSGAAGVAIEKTTEVRGVLVGADSLEEAVLEVANLLKGDARDGFIEYANEAIEMADTVEEVVDDIVAQFARLAHAKQLAELAARAEELRALIELQEAERDFVQSSADDRSERVAELEAELRAARETRTELQRLQEAGVALSREQQVEFRQANNLVEHLTGQIAHLRETPLMVTSPQTFDDLAALRSELELVEATMAALVSGGEAVVQPTLRTRKVPGAGDEDPDGKRRARVALEGSLAWLRERQSEAREEWNHAVGEEMQAMWRSVYEMYTDLIEDIERLYRDAPIPLPEPSALTRVVLIEDITPEVRTDVVPAREMIVPTVTRTETAPIAVPELTQHTREGTEAYQAYRTEVNAVTRDLALVEAANRAFALSMVYANRTMSEAEEGLLDFTHGLEGLNRLAQESRAQQEALAAVQRLAAVEAERHANVLADITDGSEHDAAVRETNIHLIVRQNQATSDHTNTLDALRQASYEAGVETEELAHHLERARLRYEATAEGAAKVASEHVRLTQLQYALAEATGDMSVTLEDVQAALDAEAEALRALREEIDETSPEYEALARRIIANEAARLANTIAILNEAEAAALLKLQGLDPQNDAYREQLRLLQEIRRARDALTGGSSGEPQILEVTGLGPALREFAAQTEGAARGVALFGAAIAGALANAPVLGAALNNLSATVDETAGTIEISMDWLAFLADVLGEALAASEVFARLIELLGKLLEPVVESLDMLLKPLMPLFEALVEFVNIVQRIFSMALEPIAAILTPIVSALSAFLNAVVAVIDWLVFWRDLRQDSPREVSDEPYQQPRDDISRGPAMERNSVDFWRMMIRHHQQEADRTGDPVRQAHHLEQVKWAQEHLALVQGVDGPRSSAEGSIEYLQQEAQRLARLRDASTDEMLIHELNMDIRDIEEEIRRLRDLGVGVGDDDPPGAPGSIARLQWEARQLGDRLSLETDEGVIATLNRQLRAINDEIRRLQDLGLSDDEVPGREPLEDITFGSTPQTMQFAIATPLAEAADTMLHAAELMESVFEGMLPESFTPTGGGMAAFTGVLDRMAPVLERLLDEGVSISVAGSGEASGGMGTGVLRYVG